MKWQSTIFSNIEKNLKLQLCYFRGSDIFAMRNLFTIYLQSCITFLIQIHYDIIKSRRILQILRVTSTFLTTSLFDNKMVIFGILGRIQERSRAYEEQAWLLPYWKIQIQSPRRIRWRDFPSQNQIKIKLQQLPKCLERLLWSFIQNTIKT